MCAEWFNDLSAESMLEAQQKMNVKLSKTSTTNGTISYSATVGNNKLLYLFIQKNINQTNTQAQRPNVSSRQQLR